MPSPLAISCAILLSAGVKSNKPRTSCASGTFPISTSVITIRNESAANISLDAPLVGIMCIIDGNLILDAGTGMDLP